MVSIGFRRIWQVLPKYVDNTLSPAVLCFSVQTSHSSAFKVDIFVLKFHVFLLLLLQGRNGTFWDLIERFLAFFFDRLQILRIVYVVYVTNVHYTYQNKLSFYFKKLSISLTATIWKILIFFCSWAIGPYGYLVLIVWTSCFLELQNFHTNYEQKKIHSPLWKLNLLFLEIKCINSSHFEKIFVKCFLKWGKL